MPTSREFQGSKENVNHQIAVGAGFVGGCGAAGTRERPRRAECGNLENMGDFLRSRLSCPASAGSAATQAELRSLAELTVQNDDADYARIAYWDAGAPAYRWMDWLNARATSGAPLPPFVHRAYTYLALAMHDATIATWESKYAYNRQRPSERAHHVVTAVAVPNSPSYPSEHAATAQAAATVLAYFFRRRRGPFKPWQTRQAGRASLRVCNTRVTTRPAALWV